MISVVFFVSIFFISLFIFYIFCENDFILIRKNLTLKTLFNNIFIAMLIAFIAGRIFYVFDTYKTFFINPFIFFNFFKYTGFSILGAFFGGIVAMAYLTKGTNASGRILDIISLSFYPYLIFYMFSKPFTMQFTLIRVIIILIFILLFAVFINLHKNYSLKDASIFFAVTIIFSHMNLLYDIYNFHKSIIFYFAFSDIISIFFIIFTIILLIRNERKFFIKSK